MQPPDRTALPLAGAIRTFITQALILAITMAAAGGHRSSCRGAGGPDHVTCRTFLNKTEAQRGLPVAFEATVTYYNKTDVDLFVQEGGDAIYVETKRNQDLTPGDRVQVRGRTRSSFTTDALSEGLTVLHHGVLPQPVAANFEQLIRAQRDCMRVSVRATVRSADMVNFGNTHGIYLELLMDGGAIDATVADADVSRLKELLDADVEVTGVVSGKFDSKMQLIGILLELLCSPT